MKKKIKIDEYSTGIIICASYRKELCEILMERWTMPRMLP